MSRRPSIPRKSSENEDSHYLIKIQNSVEKNIDWSPIFEYLSTDKVAHLGLFIYINSNVAKIINGSETFVYENVKVVNKIRKLPAVFSYKYPGESYVSSKETLPYKAFNYGYLLIEVFIHPTYGINLYMNKYINFISNYKDYKFFKKNYIDMSCSIKYLKLLNHNNKSKVI